MTWLLTSFPSVVRGSAGGLISAYRTWHYRRIERNQSLVFFREEGHRVEGVQRLAAARFTYCQRS